MLPVYDDMLQLVEKSRGWIKFDERFGDVLDRLKIQNYPELYLDQTLLDGTFLSILLDDE
jgi:hypothetical protein